MKSLNRDLSVSLSQYATRQYQTPLLLIDYDTYDDLICKKRYFVIVPIHSDIEIYKNMVIAPSAVEGEQTLAINYGSVFVVLDVLRNYEDEVEGLEPGYMVVTVQPLFILDASIISGTKQRSLN